MNNKYEIVFGNDCMALYRDGELVAAATKLTFGDIIDHCGIRCDLIEADLDLYDDPVKFPQQFKDVIWTGDVEEVG